MTDDLNRTQYILSERSRRVDALYAHGKQFDSALLTLSGGALLLSITFLKDIAPHPTHLRWLVAAWACYGSSVVLILVSLLFAQLEDVRAIKSVFDSPEKKSNGGATIAANVCAVAALLAFVGGTVSLATFALRNVPITTP